MTDNNKNNQGHSSSCPNTKPNILLLLTDQQRFDTIASAGYHHMITPNLDRLVKEGCLFTNAYSPNPICIPARHNLITGLTARYHTYPGNRGHSFTAPLPVLPRILSDGGYDTRAIGKMHWRPARRHHGFHKMELMEEVPATREADEYAMYLKSVGYGHIHNIHGVRGLLYMAPQRSQIPEDHHGSTWVGNRSVEYLRTNQGRQPFFLWSSWIAPHPPFDVPDTFADLYRDANIPEPYKSETPLSYLADKRSRYVGDIPNAKVMRRMRELYFSQISLVDKNVGKILDALKEIGQLDNTLIIFTSDHGDMLGDHECFAKSLPYDSCAKIPFIIRYPQKLKPGTRNECFVDLNDILPTCLDVAGLAYPEPRELPGESIFATAPQKNRLVQYMENGNGFGRWISLRDQRYKFNYYYAKGYEELFDMEKDPTESTNLLTSPPPWGEIEEVRNKLRAKLLEYEQRWGLENYAHELDFLKIEPPDLPKKRNIQFPRWGSMLVDEQEKKNLKPYFQEVLDVIKNEPWVKLHQLDYAQWAKTALEQRFISEKNVDRIRKKEL